VQRARHPGGQIQGTRPAGLQHGVPLSTARTAAGDGHSAPPPV
jgi:hypothetical protein